MKFYVKANLLAAALLFTGMAVQAQDDPTIMVINGKAIPRSEFEYSYNKNNTETVVDRKEIDEYVDLFINYKLKVIAAQEAGIDTTTSFRSEFLLYRNQQLRPSFISDKDMESEAWRVYTSTQQRVDSTGGLVKAAHIYVALRQTASDKMKERAKARIDSIYDLLKNNADFAETARNCSEDRRSAVNGGDLSWIQKGMTIKDFEEKIYSMEVGEMSEPFLSTAGYHIVLIKDKRDFFPYDSVKNDIMRYIDQRGVRERIITDNIDSIAKATGVTTNDVLDQRAAELTAEDDQLKYLINEYYDGLLLYEISNRNVWEKAAQDSVGLEAFFKKNKKKYSWDSPRFKGIAYHVKQAEDVQAVKDALKDVPFDKWADRLRKQFNDTTVRIQVVKSIFKEGDNALIDSVIFKKDTIPPVVKNYPIPATYGVLLKQPKSYGDVREFVVADYQDMLEKQWVAELRRKYPVEVYKEVVATVNKH